MGGLWKVSLPINSSFGFYWVLWAEKWAARANPSFSVALGVQWPSSQEKRSSWQFSEVAPIEKVLISCGM